MFSVLKNAWALLLGMMLLQVGNGMQSTLLGIRGEIEGFSTASMSLIMSGYFVGFLFGSRIAPDLLRKVGHVRVFAALASLISAVMIMYPWVTDPYAWTAGRILVGFCFSGVYVTAESWLNDSTDNENRGQALALYMIMQMLGIVTSQALLVLADPGGFILFIIPSVLISLAFTPILLSISPVPAHASAKPLSLFQIWRASPLGCVGMLLLGGIFSAQFGMASVFGTQAGLSVAQISTFVSAFFVGALVLQFPIGWLSDRMDRRLLIMGTSSILGGAAIFGALFSGAFWAIVVSAVIVGGMSNPLYSLLLAYVNDYLDHDAMAGAAGGMVFINGLGAVSGPLLLGWIMSAFGPPGFFIFIALLGAVLAAYAGFRMTIRPAPAASETDSYAIVTMSSSPAAVSFATEYAIDTAQEDETSENPRSA
ncbi:MAG: MFS transporter [Pseudomonadota bacterium]